ncbi:MAG: efflux transporter outer membrane subunit [Planctomycetota bacterium]
MTFARPSRPPTSPAPTARVGVLVAALALACGCRAVGPDYVRPAVPVPPQFRDAAAAAPTGAGPSGPSLADLPWWQAFQDPALQGLLRDGLAGNEDLRAALARVAEARARVGVAASERYPQIDAGVSATRDRASRDLLSEGSRTTSTYRGTVSASWELDLWGRVRRGEEAALADWMASEEGRRSVVVTLVGDIAEAYFDLRELDEELAIARETRDTREKTLELFTQRIGEGVSSRLETSQAEADFAFAAATIPDLERRITQQENLLSFLVGRTPGPVPRGRSLGAAALPPVLPTGLPATLLERRPDVRAAEAEVIAANARVGVAVAEFFPRLDLLALVGLGTQELSGLSADGSSFASVGGSLLAPIFQGGRLAGNRDAALARRDEAVARFRRAAQNAFRDVADQLAAVKGARDARVQQERQVAALGQALELSSSRFSNGLAAYFEVLDAQRTLFPARLALARTKRDQYVALVRLYRALGGGWCSECFPCVTPPPIPDGTAGSPPPAGAAPPPPAPPSSPPPPARATRGPDAPPAR